MKHKFLKSVFASFVIATSSLANAAVITFEDFNTSLGWDSEQFGWTLHNSAVFTNLWAPSTVSGDNALTNYNSRVGEFTRDTLFNFDGAYFTRDGRYTGTTAQVNVFGLDELGNTIFSTQLSLTNSPEFFTFGWENIYGIAWDPIGAADVNNIAIDNFTYSEVSTDIPEPSSVAIFALGLMGLASRKFKKSA